MQLNPAPGPSSSSAAHPSLPSSSTSVSASAMAVHASPSHAQSQSARPASDYQGEFIKFTVASMAEFDNWRLEVEAALTVDFVRGDKHSSRASPRAFKEHVKMVCARHSRSGRKPYEKKHPERQRRVPSRKVGGEGCPAVITYRTFDDRDQVDVEYWPRHSHEIGEANWAFTREGRRQASSHRGGKASIGGRSHTDELDNYPRSGTDSGLDWLTTPTNLTSTTTADPNTYSPYSANSRSPASVSPPQLHQHSPAPFIYGMSQQHMSLSPAVSPTSNASHTPALSARPLEGTPANRVTGLPTPSRPMQPLPGTPMGLQNGTPMLNTHGLPTPSHHGGNLPQPSPVSPNYSFGYNMNGYSSAQPSPVQQYSPGLPVSAHHTPAQQQLLLSTNGTPAQHYAALSTPGQHPLDLASASPADASMLLSSASPLHITTDLQQQSMYYDVGLELDYGPASAGSAHSGMLSVPNDSINLTITSSPSPHPSPLVTDAPQPFGAVDLSVTADSSLPQSTSGVLSQSSSSSSGLLNTNAAEYTSDGIMDLRADRWRKMKNLFDHVHSASHAQQLPEEMVSRLEHTVRQLWNQVQLAQTAGFDPQPLGMGMNMINMGMGAGVGNGSVSLLGLGPQGHGHHGHHSHGSMSPHIGSPHLGNSHQHLR